MMKKARYPYNYDIDSNVIKRLDTIKEKLSSGAVEDEIERLKMMEVESNTSLQTMLFNRPLRAMFPY